MNTTLTDLANALVALRRIPYADSKNAIDSIVSAIKRLADQVGNETPQTADERPWIPWSGGECPLAYITPVEVKLRNGETEMNQAAGFVWRHDGASFDIIAFRLAPQNSQE